MADNITLSAVVIIGLRVDCSTKSLVYRSPSLAYSDYFYP